MNNHKGLAPRHIYFVLFVVASSLAFWLPMKQLVEFADSCDYGSHIFLIPPITFLLIYVRRHEIFSLPEVRGDRIKNIFAGCAFLLAATALLLTTDQRLTGEKLSLEILSLVLLWISAFIFCYGTISFIRARFPLLFLLLLIPIPGFVIDKVIFALQSGSSDVAYGLLRILRVPVFKEGFIIQLPMVNLEVAKECSGIRSSIALLVTVLLAAEFLLRSPWRKVLLVVAIIPILVIKNGVRIVTIYLLAAYVNPAFLHGWLHTSGGVVFYLLGLVALVPVASWLKRGERKNVKLPTIPKLAHVTSF